MKCMTEVSIFLFFVNVVMLFFIAEKRNTNNNNTNYKQKRTEKKDRGTKSFSAVTSISRPNRKKVSRIHAGISDGVILE